MAVIRKRRPVPVDDVESAESSQDAPELAPLAMESPAPDADTAPPVTPDGVSDALPDGHPDQPGKPRRGRPARAKVRKRKARPTPPPRPDNEEAPAKRGRKAAPAGGGLEFSVGPLLVSIHKVAAAALRTPELEIADNEGEALGAALDQVMRAFAVQVSPKAQALAALGTVCALVYGPRAAVIAARRKEERAARRASNGAAGPAMTAEQVAAAATMAASTPINWGDAS